jgi:putative NADH-flavin reductase
MKISIIGAGGRTGIEVVKYAKEKGFDVIAFVHSENSNKYFPAGIEIKTGDVLDYDKVISAIKGTEVVVSVLGHTRGSDPLMQTKGMENIVMAMKELGIKRILSLTGTGARTEGDSPSITDIFLNFIIKLVDPDRIKDGIEHVKVLKNSELDWTIIRVLKLTNNDKVISNYKLTDGGPAELLTNRKKVARVLVDLVSDGSCIHKLPVISG